MRDIGPADRWFAATFDARYRSSGTLVERMMSDADIWRRTSQRVPPASVDHAEGSYDIYPAYVLGPGKIGRGASALAALLAAHRLVAIDGYGGVLWSCLRKNIDLALRELSVNAVWIDVFGALKADTDIDVLTAPFLGGNDPLFGTRFTFGLSSFFDDSLLGEIKDYVATAQSSADLVIVYGTGASLPDLTDAFTVYIDVPKDEIQFRSRAGSVVNLGAKAPVDAKSMYKRFYFVDWPALNAHKQALLPRIDLFVDDQRPDDLTFISGQELRGGLAAMSESFFRVRPWFEPGPWGGHWIQEHVKQLPQDVPNYAWSFELIVPENGIAFESDGVRLEASFDCLMFTHSSEVLGEWAENFGTEFPIRFDWLDTIGGGNLSVQCHPRPDYIRRHFGESFTQDETYYILDNKPGAEVYLGFKEGVDPAEFRMELERSFNEAVPIDVEIFVAKWPAKKHDLFLIPNGTIHCSGEGSLVLEISATPYIFTFKMYDWMRLDLEGRPRTLNIDRAFDNLYFDRQGERIEAEFISKPVELEAGTDYRVIHVPTHAEHFYDVHRFEFDTEIAALTAGSPHVLAVVEGGPVRLTTANGRTALFQYAETFVVPAAAGKYTLINEGPDRAKVIKAFIKSEHS
jgi:mannose-6-phosphate isomerase class I